MAAQKSRHQRLSEPLAQIPRSAGKSKNETGAAAAGRSQLRRGQSMADPSRAVERGEWALWPHQEGELDQAEIDRIDRFKADVLKAW
jgi:hypothetical protein